MNARILGMLGLAAIAGCATVPGGGFGPAPDGASTLGAYLIPGTQYNTGYAFDLNQDAYVAVFRISPRMGTTLLYPRPGMGRVDKLTHQGLTYVPGRLTRFASNYPRDVRASRVAEPDFYILIASETPLDMSSVGPFGDGLRFALGAGGSQMISPHRTMERLVSLVVDDPTQNNWATDFYVDWPEVVHSRPSPGLVQVRCGDMTAYVPIEFADRAIAQLCDPEGEPQNPAPSDSSATATPVHRSPPRLDDRIASRQLEAPRAFEASLRRAERRLDDRDLGAGSGYEPIDRSNRLRRSGDGAGVNRRIGEVRDDIGRPAIDRSRGGSATSGRAEPRGEGVTRSPSGGGGGAVTRSNPAIKDNS